MNTVNNKLVTDRMGFVVEEMEERRPIKERISKQTDRRRLVDVVMAQSWLKISWQSKDDGLCLFICLCIQNKHNFNELLEWRMLKQFITFTDFLAFITFSGCKIKA